jgi:cytoskeletal protein CcmA (bactofilin family)
MGQDDKSSGWIRRSLGRQEAAASQTPVTQAASVEPAEHPAKQRPIEGFGTFIGQGAEFVGTLRLSGSFRIDTEFQGEIVTDGKVIVGESGGVESDIRAREVVIAGAVKGNVVATRQLTIRATGRLTGDAESPSLEVERGAFLNGRTTMVRPEVSARAEKSAPEREATQTTTAPSAQPAPGAASY